MHASSICPVLNRKKKFFFLLGPPNRYLLKSHWPELRTVGKPCLQVLTAQLKLNSKTLLSVLVQSAGRYEEKSIFNLTCCCPVQNQSSGNEEKGECLLGEQLLMTATMRNQ